MQQKTTNYSFSLAETIRSDVLNSLYRKQEKYWTSQLADIAIDNAKYHNKTGEYYGIHYLGKNWRGWYYQPAEDHTFLSLHPEYAPKIEKKLLNIVNELAQLEIEQYEASRFLSGLVLFPAPIEIYEKILGKELFKECDSELEYYVTHELCGTWDSNSQAALTTYVAQHDYILKAMHQRLLINLITRDQIGQ